MPGAPVIHTTDSVYGPPVLRATSPSESISTEYGPDETSLSDAELTDEQFARKAESRIYIRRAAWADTDSSKLPVLLPKPRTDSEEMMLFEQVMKNLRSQVKALENEELFEATALKTLAPAFEQQPVTHDIDSIMRSMMGSSISPIQNSSMRKSPMTRMNGNESDALSMRHASGTPFSSSRPLR